ncbi:uncharacterized protein J3D65DRAFT_162991 [Phyllosticta citribraziliensis]|uniref:Uncharacterized protein n=1 Tax=Phyllosticta citribraziliensis TaxID=989973 RepID=A0ABR1L671_9PEZI
MPGQKTGDGEKGTRPDCVSFARCASEWRPGEITPKRAGVLHSTPLHSAPPARLFFLSSPPFRRSSPTPTSFNDCSHSGQSPVCHCLSPRRPAHSSLNPPPAVRSFPSFRRRHIHCHSAAKRHTPPATPPPQHVSSAPFPLHQMLHYPIRNMAVHSCAGRIEDTWHCQHGPYSATAPLMPIHQHEPNEQTPTLPHAQNAPMADAHLLFRSTRGPSGTCSVRKGSSILAIK